jgi:Tol biopolymer transport system component
MTTAVSSGVTIMRGLLSLATLAFIAGCSDPTSTGIGGASIRIITTGDDPDLDGYRVIVDSQLHVTAGPSGFVNIEGLSAGPHHLHLDEVAENCISDSAGTAFAVVRDEVTIVEVDVACSATGVEVSTSTTGFDQPVFSGFIAQVGSRLQPVPLQGVTRMSRLKPGNYSVTLQTHENCSVVGPASRSATVKNRELVPVAFEIECVDTKKEIIFVRDTVVAGLPVTGIVSASASGAGIFELLRAGSAPAWSPDGNKIVFSTTLCDYYDFYYGLPCSGGLSVIDLRTRLVSILDGADAGIDPAWSADGTSIAFVHITPARTRLMLATLDGRPPVELATTAYSVGHPTWSPDGSRIAFGCTVAAATLSEICMINRDGTGFKVLTNNPDWSATPAWSPDGSTIAFLVASNSAQVIYLMATDGTSMRQLSIGRDPAWSRDGSKILFAGSSGLFTIRLDGSSLTRLTTGNHREPAWCP